MRSLLQDIRYAWRTLLNSPGFTFVAVLTLALGIGANSTIFSWINSTLLNPIPGARTANMVAVTRAGNVDLEHFFSYPDFLDLRERSHSFRGMMASTIDYVDLTGVGRPEKVWSALVSANYFELLGVSPILGRGFTSDEEKTVGGSPVVVIGYDLWQSHFGGQRSALGATISVNRHPYTIVGVAPAGFQGNQTGLRVQMWIPLVMLRDLVMNAENSVYNRGDQWLLAYARLKPRVSEQQAREELNLLMQQIAQQYPDSHRGVNDVEVLPLWRSRFGANYYLYILLPMLLAIAGAVLLLACANVANLMLVRSVSRRREISIRLALGAGRWRLVRQLMVESLMLALVGGGVAVLLTTWSAGGLTRFLPPSSLPLYLQVRPGRAVLLITLAISVITGLIFGILPALRSSRLTPVTVLKEEAGSVTGGLRKARLSNALVVVQLALSLLLLVCAGLFIRTFRAEQKFDVGFNSDRVLLTTYDLFSQGYDREKGREFNRKLLAKLRALPGMESVTFSNWIPLGFIVRSSVIQPEGYTAQPHESMLAAGSNVGPNYFHTMQIPLVAGRDFDDDDTEKSQPVIVVNEAFVKRYWPGQQALGKRVYVDEGRDWYAVVGVARDSSYNDLRETHLPFVYLPVFQAYANGLTIHARSAGDAMAMGSVVEKSIHELDPNLPVFDVGTLRDHIGTVTMSARIAGTSVGIFGLLALVLAAVGIYGVIAYTTRLRTREIGIRMALGAQRMQVLRLVLGQGMWLTVIGVVIGLALSLALTRLLSSLLFGVTPTDLVTFAGVTILLCGVALGACYLPAHRATAVDPMVVLRYE
jgi:predicted permease